MECKYNKQRLDKFKPSDQKCTLCSSNPRFKNNFEPKLDLSFCTNIDMEFSDDKAEWEVGKLCQILTNSFIDEHNVSWNYCRVREAHWHAWIGESGCPLPEGLTVEVLLRNGTSETGTMYLSKNWCWMPCVDYNNIIAVKVINND